ncbi:MAG TPA: RluA family pseudouridine synthase [Pirellulales bacterium]|jgi:23S rRNA pseudouridine1911/1915/1917 synthase|nr:RluA family pseudouridine synthase [Pirellulales bacterium]
MALRILFEDNHLLALDKPAGIATMGALPGEPSFAAEAKAYLKHQYQKPGNVYLGIVSRLDALVSGVILFARTSKAAARLTEQFKTRAVEKSYWALVEGLLPSSGVFSDWLLKDDQAQRMRSVAENAAGAQWARLAYERLRTLADATFVEVRLETGRKHQIRVQFAERGHPILGDQKYGSRRPFPRAIALHSRRLRFEHPVSGETIELAAPLPHAWRRFGIEPP